MNRSELVRVAMHYRGNVQGVGFRLTAARLARGTGVVGWVRNEPDGGVRLEAEGERAAVDRFLDNVRDALDDHIADEVAESLEPLGRESEFAIRH